MTKLYRFAVLYPALPPEAWKQFVLFAKEFFKIGLSRTNVKGNYTIKVNASKEMIEEFEDALKRAVAHTLKESAAEEGRSSAVPVPAEYAEKSFIGLLWLYVKRRLFGKRKVNDAR